MFKNTARISELLHEKPANCHTLDNPNRLPPCSMRFYSTEPEAKNAADGDDYYYCPTNHTWYVPVHDGQEAAILR
jgi:hypothetical protein